MGRVLEQVVQISNNLNNKMSANSHLLSSLRFLPLFITQFFGAFNDNVLKNAFLIWFTYEISQKRGMDAQVMASVAAGLFILPFFLFSSLAGQLADKYRKSRLIQIIKIVEIGIMSFCFIGFYFENIYLLLALIFLMGVHSTFFGPMKYSLLPEHLQQQELLRGNALIEGGTFLAILLGTILGGLVIRLGNGIAIISIVTVAVAVIGWLSSRFIPQSVAADPKLKISFNIARETWKIISYAKKKKVVWLSIIGISWFWFIGATFLSQFPTYTKNIIGGDEYVVTLFLSIFSIGIGVGSMLCNKMLKGKVDGRLVPLGSMGITLGVIIFCVASYFYDASAVEGLLGLREFLLVGGFSWMIILGLLMIAVSSGIYIVPLYAIMQRRSQGKYLSRVIAANNILNALFMVGSSLGVLVLLGLGLELLEILLMVGVGNLVMLFWVSGVARVKD